MKKNRYLLCLLLCAFMFYFAVPRLSLTIQGAKGVFSIAWLVFALLVFAGNLTGLLFTPKKAAAKTRPDRLRKKSRSYH